VVSVWHSFLLKGQDLLQEAGLPSPPSKDGSERRWMDQLYEKGTCLSRRVPPCPMPVPVPFMLESIGRSRIDSECLPPLDERTSGKSEFQPYLPPVKSRLRIRGFNLPFSCCNIAGLKLGRNDSFLTPCQWACRDGFIQGSA
jgi:hypothetical protein